MVSEARTLRILKKQQMTGMSEIFVEIYLEFFSFLDTTRNLEIAEEQRGLMEEFGQTVICLFLFIF